MNNKYKIVFIDIDGTLVNDEKIVPEENIKMIQQYSGRSYTIHYWF